MCTDNVCSASTVLLLAHVRELSVAPGIMWQGIIFHLIRLLWDISTFHVCIYRSISTSIANISVPIPTYFYMYLASFLVHLVKTTRGLKALMYSQSSRCNSFGSFFHMRFHIIIMYFMIIRISKDGIEVMSPLFFLSHIQQSTITFCWYVPMSNWFLKILQSR